MPRPPFKVRGVDRLLFGGLNGLFIVVLLFFLLFSCSLLFSFVLFCSLLFSCSVLSGTTALHRACSRGAYQVVVELLDGNGADPCATDANGWTGLHCCGYYSTAEHGKIAKELLDRDVNVRLSFFEILLWFHDGETPRKTN